MHPNVKKYASFVKLTFDFNGECERFEDDLKSFTEEVEHFQKGLDEWIHSNAEIVKQMPVPGTEHAFHVIEIMKKASELSKSMTALYKMESAYSKFITDFNKKLLAMSTNKNAEQLIRDLPRKKKFCEENFSEIRNKIVMLKTERKNVEHHFKELKLFYTKSLN